MKKYLLAIIVMATSGQLAAQESVSISFGKINTTYTNQADDHSSGSSSATVGGSETISIGANETFTVGGR